MGDGGFEGAGGAAEPGGEEAKGGACRGQEADAPQDPPPLKVLVPRYGGNFAWVGAGYRLKVHRRGGPLQLLNGIARKLFMSGDMVLMPDGTFWRPGDRTPLFPMGGVDIRWRWDGVNNRLVFDFWKDDNKLVWRWDELTPSADLRFPSLVPDWNGVGHVGASRFTYSMLSAVAEDAEAELPQPSGSPTSAQAPARGSVGGRPPGQT